MSWTRQGWSFSFSGCLVLIDSVGFSAKKNQLEFETINLNSSSSWFIETESGSGRFLVAFYQIIFGIATNSRICLFIIFVREYLNLCVFFAFGRICDWCCCGCYILSNGCLACLLVCGLYCLVFVGVQAVSIWM